MIKSKEKTIDGITFEVTAFTGREGFRIKTKLIKLLAPSIASLAGSLKGVKSVLEADLSGDDISEALMKLTDKLNEDEFLALVMRMLASTRMHIVNEENGQKEITNITNQVFDMQFSGNFMTVYKVLGFVVEVNYGNFFGEGGISKMMPSLREKAGQIPSSKKQTEDLQTF